MEHFPLAYLTVRHLSCETMVHVRFDTEAPATNKRSLSATLISDWTGLV